MLKILCSHRGLPLHLLKVNIATRVDNIIAANKVDLTIRSEHNCIASVELNLGYFKVLKVGNLLGRRDNGLINLVLAIQESICLRLYVG